MKLVRGILPHLSEIKRHRSLFIMAVCSALLMRGAFPPLNYWWFAWFCLAPLVVALLRAPDKKISFFLGLTWGFFFYYSSLFWMNQLVRYNGFAWMGILILGLYCALFPAAVCWIWSLLRQRHEKKVFWLTLPALWVLGEYVRSLGELGFPWSHLSSSQYKALPLIQICDLMGTYFISFLIVMVNAVIGGLAHTRNPQWKRALPGILAALVLVGGTIVYSLVPSGSTEEIPQLNVAILQRNIPQEKIYASYSLEDEEQRSALAAEIEDDMFGMIDSLEQGAFDLIVLPETAFPVSFLPFEKRLIQRLEQRAQEHDADILFGAGRFVPKVALEQMKTYEDIKMFNSAWYVDRATGFHLNAYDKMQLVPFGEYLPLVGNIPFLRNIIFNIGDMTRGEEQTLFTCEGHQFGVMICFESTFPYLARRLAKEGAEFLTVVTNDGWFGMTSALEMHLSHAVFRAIETRRDVVQCANTGISAVVDSRGRIVREIRAGKRDRIKAVIHTSSPTQLTLYTRWGDVFVLLCFVIVFCIEITALIQKRSPRMAS